MTALIATGVAWLLILAILWYANSIAPPQF